MSAPATVPITVLVVLLISALFVLFARWVDKRDRAATTKRARLVDALKSLTYSCDGRYLTITRSEKWADDMSAHVNVSTQLRQVFTISAPGHADIRHCHLVDDGLVRLAGAELPKHFDRPIELRPRVFRPKTSDEVRRSELPYLAVELNLDQAALDATTVELAGHELRCVVEHDGCRVVGCTDWTDYHPTSSDKDTP
ncbi:hypothetical protein [Brachybacterium kimchii]|uniref:Uncharacterized protein n=1 Tax=Brachybacterium kimchii TaxID=2942909 RepID=A0ABY4N8R2_9MICO|nr:hypothetical protein [Brachybacterium kimchii]UQN30504.1 hypothetical protein M4486_03940 [Brachybacterium kimchii]